MFLLCQEGRTVFTELEVSQGFDLARQLTQNCSGTILSLPDLRPGKGSSTLYVQADSDERPVKPVVVQSPATSQMEEVFQMLCASGLAQTLTSYQAPPFPVL